MNRSTPMLPQLRLAGARRCGRLVPIANEAAAHDVQPPSAQRFNSYQPDYEQPRSDEDAYTQPPMGEARQSPAGQQGQIDEIRASLREFREAVRELTESRSRRRYF